MDKRTMLVSVTNKEGLEKLKPLSDSGQWDIISTGGTAAKLRELGMEVMEVSDFTGMPEMMDGRLKTLHPKVLGGILAIRANAEHQVSLRKTLDSDFIDMVIVNLYDFANNPSIEHIDIGGPTMIRAAAKNWLWVSVVVDPNDYDQVVKECARDGRPLKETRRYLAAKTFGYTARYDAAIAEWFEKDMANSPKPEEVF